MARNGDDFDACARCCRDEQRPRVAHERRAGIGDEGDTRASLQALDDRRHTLAFVVLVQGFDGCLGPGDAARIEQLAGVPGVLASSSPASRRTAAARGLKSCRLPIGVATTNSVPPGVRPVEFAAVSVTRPPKDSGMLHVSLRPGQARTTAWLVAIAWLACAWMTPAAQAQQPGGATAQARHWPRQDGTSKLPRFTNNRRGAAC